MKRILPLILLLAIADSAFGVGGNAVIVYFSMPERDAVDAVAGASRVLDKGKVVGNVEWIARVIQRSIGGDIAALSTVQQYPAKHAPLVDQADAEKRARARPRLRDTGVNFESYDLIFLGYPIWWADLPMPVYAFLETHDFRGKTIIPFSSHGGSGLAGTIDTITRMEPKAKVIQDGFTVSRDRVGQSDDAIQSWLGSLALISAR